MAFVQTALRQHGHLSITSSAQPGIKKWLLVVAISASFVLAGTMPSREGSAPFVLMVPAAGTDYDVLPVPGPKKKGLRKPKLISLRAPPLPKKKKEEEKEEETEEAVAEQTSKRPSRFSIFWQKLKQVLMREV